MTTTAKIPLHVFPAEFVLPELVLCPFHIAIYLPHTAQLIAASPMSDKAKHVIQRIAEKESYFMRAFAILELVLQVDQENRKRIPGRVPHSDKCSADDRIVKDSFFKQRLIKKKNQ